LWIAAGVCYESWQDAVRARQLQMIDPLSLIRLKRVWSQVKPCAGSGQRRLQRSVVWRLVMD